MDEARRLLDELMGKTRNTEGQQNKGRHFSDADVDKFFLAGFSPWQEFKNTKSALWLPDCYRLAFPNRPRLKALEWEQWSRNEDLKAQYDEISQSEKDKYGFEYDLMIFLQELVSKCDARIRVVHEEVKQKNLQMQTGGISPTDQTLLTTIAKDIDEIMSKLEEANDTGSDADLLKALMCLLDQKKKEKEECHRRIEIWREENQRAVCEISGNVILAPRLWSTMKGTHDQPGIKTQNIHDHEAGKQYQGWKMARELLVELRTKGLQPASKVGRRSASRSRGRGSRSRGRGRRDRSRSGKRDRSRSGRRDRSRSAAKRDRDRGGERRERSRSRSAANRDRDRSGRDRERERSRDRRRR